MMMVLFIYFIIIIFFLFIATTTKKRALPPPSLSPPVSYFKHFEITGSGFYNKRIQVFFSAVPLNASRRSMSSLISSTGSSSLRPFTTVYGRGLLEEVKFIANRKYVIVTMEDLWKIPSFPSAFASDSDSYEVYFVKSLEAKDLKSDLQQLQGKIGEPIRCVVGVGGGQAIDVAKFFSWSLGNITLFQVPTALTVDAPWGHRAAIRYEGVVRYVGFAVPEAVYIDYGIIQSAPKRLNLSGVGDVLCFHTADADWRIAQEDSKCGNWPYDEDIANLAKEKLNLMVNNLSEIKDMTEKAIRIICTAFQFGGAAFHAFGWNPRPLEGFDHLFFYALEHRTRKHFIHGYPVMLGIFLGSLLQNNRAEWVLDVIKNGCGIDIRPEEMKISWEDVKKTLLGLKDFVKENDYMYTIASRVDITEEFIEKARVMLYDFYAK